MGTIRQAAWAGVAVLSSVAVLGMASAVPARADAGLMTGDARRTHREAGRLQSALEDVHRAGMPGLFAEVRDGGTVWRSAAGVADLSTSRPVTPEMRQRIGSITKTFTAAAILQQVEQGRIQLDAPIGRYLPDLVPGARGQQITVRMLLNHTSGIADYLLTAFPSLQGYPSLPDMSAQSLDDNRYQRFDPVQLIRMGLAAPAVGSPGDRPGVYSNTNYLILGQLLEQVTGMTAEDYITLNIIGRAGLEHTYFPTGPRIHGPHSRMYESFFGLLDPPRDYSVYDMSWVGVAASLISTVEDLNRFYRALLGGRIVQHSSVLQMQRTGPVISQAGDLLDYGLGIFKVEIPGCGTFWGHDGTVWGAETISLTRADGARQLSVAMNLVRWNKPDTAGGSHPIDDALSVLYQQALCGDRSTPPHGFAAALGLHPTSSTGERAAPAPH